MNGQEFKALLDVLNRIAKALESKEKNNPVDIINRFAEVYRMLDDVIKHGIISETEIVKIKEKYVEIAGEILLINDQK
jgi:sulfate adenylyltransferase subunit 1 (EFTu-like GTPase family)